MNICKKYSTERTFDNFCYQGVVFSADKVPVCPYCGMSPYEKNYDSFHRVDEEEGM